jgi:hypothetical protein
VAIGFIAMGTLPRSMLHTYFDTIAMPQKRKNANPAAQPLSPNGSHPSIDHD